MAAANLQVRIAFHHTGRGEPLVSVVTLLIGEIAGAAAEDVAVEGVAVGSYGAGIFA